MSRRLRPEEERLWAEVARAVTPLDKRPVSPELPRIRPVVRDHAAPLEPPASRARRLGAPGLATLDAAWDRRLRTGRAEPAFAVDLHGSTRDAAYSQLEQGLLAAARLNLRVVLVITGKGKTGAPYPYQEGVLRAALPQWLEAPALRPFVAALRPAHPRHGGSGAWYVILRRRRGV